MFFKLSRSLKVNRVLLISLSNIGDVVMTFPVFDALGTAFPDAAIDVVVGPKAVAFFKGNPYLSRLIPFNKRMLPLETLQWLAELRRTHFDLVIDLRNTFFPFLIRAKTVTSPFFHPDRMHMKDKHLARLTHVLGKPASFSARRAIVLASEDKLSVKKLLGGWQDYVVIAPGAADARKRWMEAGFAALLEYFHERGQAVVFVGDKADRLIADRLMPRVSGGVLNLCGQTTLLELAGILENAALALVNDSGIMHLASYLDRPVLALFGPTDPFLYGPWGSCRGVLRQGTVMEAIQPTDVVAALRSLHLNLDTGPVLG